MLRCRGALAWWFLAVALVAGLGFMVVIPPGGGADEPHQFLRVWQLAHGQVTPAVAPDGEVLGSFPACYTSFLERRQAHPVPFPRRGYWDSPAGCARARPVIVSMGNTAVNSPATYLASAVADAVAVHVGLSVPAQLLAARFGEPCGVPGHRLRVPSCGAGEVAAAAVPRRLHAGVARVGIDGLG